MKTRMPKIAKAKTPHAGRLPHGQGHTAFAAGGDKAFNDPATMVQPDQAFSAAMAMPQGANAVPLPPSSE